MFGGVAAAPMIGLAFIEILVASIAIAFVLGLLSLGLAMYFDHIRKRLPGIGFLVNRLTGGIFGGLLAVVGLALLISGSKPQH